jgi:hypothetical protein
MSQTRALQLPSLEFPSDMQFDGGSPFTRRSTASLPTCCQLLGESDTTAIFEHDGLKVAQQLHRNLLLCLNHHTGHLF